MLLRKRHNKYCLINTVFEMPEMTAYSMAEIYGEYKKHRICNNGVIKPHILSDEFMKGHTPLIEYESTDYLSNYSNWSIYDKLYIQNNFIKYIYSEITDCDSILITGSMFLGSIYSLLIIINRILKTPEKESKVNVNMTITSNEKMIFRMQPQVMRVDDYFLETYYLHKGEKHEIDFTFNAIDVEEINKFTNKFLGLFTSENPRSKTPFLSVSYEETRKFYEFLIFKDRYLVTGN